MFRGLSESLLLLPLEQCNNIQDFLWLISVCQIANFLNENVKYQGSLELHNRSIYTRESLGVWMVWKCEGWNWIKCKSLVTLKQYGSVSLCDIALDF